MDTEALTIHTHQPVGLVRDPEAILDDASRAAKALMQIVGNKETKLMFNGKQYLEVDDWQVIGTFHGCTADIEWTRPITVGDAQGWEARAVLMDRTGRELSHAETMCLDDEERWRDRPKYAWCYVLKGGGHAEDDPGSDAIVWEANPFKPGKMRPKKERLQVGVEAVPSFQLRSMAQTRAIARVHANVFRWVSQLAGYGGTPAEELPTEPVKKGEDQPTGQGDEPPHPAERSTAAATPQAGAQAATSPTTTTKKTTAKKAAPAASGKPAAPAADDGPILVTTIDPLTYPGKDDKGQPVKKPMWKLTFSNGKEGMAFEADIATLAQQVVGTDTAVTVLLEESTKRPGSFKVAELARA